MRRELRYLLHLWCDKTPDGTWRARLEQPATGSIRVFRSRDELVAHLDDEMAAQEHAPEQPGS